MLPGADEAPGYHERLDIGMTKFNLHAAKLGEFRCSVSTCLRQSPSP